MLPGLREEIRELLEQGELKNASPFLIALCELDAELAMGFTITRKDVTQLEFLALRIFNDERDKLRARQLEMDRATAETRDRAAQWKARSQKTF